MESVYPYSTSILEFLWLKTCILHNHIIEISAKKYAKECKAKKILDFNAVHSFTFFYLHSSGTPERGILLQHFCKSNSRFYRPGPNNVYFT